MCKEVSEEAKYVEGLMARAHKAQEQIQYYSQEQVDELISAIAWSVCKPGMPEKLATMAVDESGMGSIPEKVKKFTGKVPGVLYELLSQKSVGAIERDPEKKIVKFAKPVGVVAGLIPSTQPEMTPVVKAMFAIKARNAIVFSPHPYTKGTTNTVVACMRDALQKHGAPEDLILCVENPTMEVSNEVMRQADLVVATGAAGMVKAAYSSGTPAWGVGVGNDVAIIDETADVEDAAKKIFISKSFDNASGCSCENSLIIHESIYDQFLAVFKAQGAYMCTPEEKERLQKVMWPDWPVNKLSMKIVTKPCKEIAELANLPVEDNCNVIMVEETGAGRDYAFSGEKLSLVITIYKYSGDISNAITVMNKIQSYMGAGHSCAIHSFNEHNIEEVALRCKTARVMVRQGTNTGNSGYWGNGMPRTVIIGCGTWGGNAASENVVLKHFMNTTWVSEPFESFTIPTYEEIFGKDIMND